jgi:hypothetical protein
MAAGMDSSLLMWVYAVPIRTIAALEVPVKWTAGAVCSRHASATDQESLESIGMLGPANLQD